MFENIMYLWNVIVVAEELEFVGKILIKKYIPINKIVCKI